jgi:hypothetical protein
MISRPVALVALAFTLLAPGLILGAVTDAAVFTVVGQRWLDGVVPYRDVFDHKPPLTYVLTAGAQVLLGPDWRSVWILTLASAAGAGVVLFRWLSVRERSPVAFAIAALVMLGVCMYPIAEGGGLTETLGLPYGTLAFTLAASSKPRWFLVGMLAAGAALVSVQWLSIGIGLAILTYPNLAAFGRLAAGALTVLAATVGALLLTGAYAAAYDAMFTYNSAYLNLSRAGDTPGISSMLAAALPLAVATALGRRAISWTRVELAAAAWLVGGVVALATQGRLFGHYVTPLLIPLAILGTRGVDLALSRPRRGMVVGAAVVASVFLGATIGALQVMQRPQGSIDVAATVASLTGTEDTVLVWGLEAEIYDVSDRAPSGRFIYHLPLTTPGYATADMIHQWVVGLGNASPRVIVDAERYRWPTETLAFPPPPPGTAGGRDLDLVHEFRSWVAENYELVVSVRGRDIYVRRSSPASILHDPRRWP